MAMIQKWGAVDRLTHWLLIIGITTAIVTGLPLFDVATFGFLLPLWQIRLPFNLTVNLVAAILIMAAALIHVTYRAASRRSTEIMFGSNDFKDFSTITKHWFGLTKDYPRLGFHHPGQKAVYWLAPVLGIIVGGASGLILWFPEIAETWFTAAILLHDIAFVLIVVLIAGHFVLAVTPTNWPVLKAMLVTGKVPVSWAKRHHPGWTEKAAPSSVALKAPPVKADLR